MDVQKEAIVKATDEDTRRTYLYTGKTSRATYNRFHDLWETSGLDPLPFPLQVLFASGMVEMFINAQKFEYVGPFAGQVSGLIKEIKPAAEILGDMVEEAVDILARRLPAEVTAKA
jgi:NAD(P)H-dependent flavin oxidoreductase YrpB (nitropropane dioxygenase family)